ncbi:MAG: TldD/PmbA family protein [Deltaproteobacteria bacterium]|nr:TldD/PmbA family protein [Deltaproteobacteria bacterium]
MTSVVSPTATTKPPSSAGLKEMDLLDVCEVVIKRATKKGASQAECYAEHVTATSVSLEQNELKGASVAEHEAFGIRVFVGAPGQRRMGFSYVNRKDGASLDEAIDDALAIARASSPDEANELVDPLPVRPIGGLYDPRLAALTTTDAVGLAQQLLESARKKDKRVSVDSGTVSASHGETAIATTRGVRAFDVDAGVTWGLFGMAVDPKAKEGEQVGSFDHVYDAARSFDDIKVDVAGARFASQVLALLKARKGQSFSGPALFSPDAFEEIFLGALISGIDGDTVLKGKSRLKDKLGQRIASTGFSVVDDGTLSGGLGSASFDREGLPHRRTVLVGDGILHHFLYDGKTAKRAKKRPTGHAQGAARSIPGIGTTNITVGPGDRSDDELLRELGNGLLIGRFSGNVDEVSGDFSGVAKGSFLVKNGKKTAAVQETLIAGNVYELFNKLIARGSTLHRNMTTECPYVLVDGVTVTAG